MRYGRHLTEARGLAASTVLVRQRVARRTFSGRSSIGNETGVAGLRCGDVAAFLLQECSVLSVGAAKNRLTQLRSLLRYFFGEGLVTTDLAVSVPPVAGWRGTSLPATLTLAEVSALVSSCERSTPIGSRDFAILTLLARLGLRSCEVARLELGDIDWRSGDLRVRGKARGAEQRLPSPTDVGEAIADYLAVGRPRTEVRTVFLTMLAPRRGIALSRSAASFVVPASGPATQKWAPSAPPHPRDRSAPPRSDPARH